ncbi:MAG: CoA transferase [Clostridia bacterium]|nr:CoA transferase [Clostridia bacterium]
MDVDNDGNHALGKVRVLELAGELGAYTGKLFADLGAEVIRIESLDGDPTRRQKPFFRDNPGEENSLRYQYLNTNKKGMVLDITLPEGREIIRKLVQNVDILIESNPPGYLDKLGIGYEQLRVINPKLVYTAITPYGQTGPYKDYPYSDLTVLAMGGFLYMAGIENDKPAQAPDKQSYFMGDLYAAFGSIVALYHANITGEGQFVDISLQESVTTALENAIQAYDLEGRIQRASGSVEAGYGTYCCKDGYVYVMAAMGRNTHLWDPLARWLIEEKIPDAESLACAQWAEPEYRKRKESKELFKQIFERFSRQRTKQELYEESQKRKVVIYPVNTSKDVSKNPQLNHRKFFKAMRVEALGGTVCYPGAPYKLEKVPWELRKAAPYFGEDTGLVLLESGYSKSQIKSLAERGVVYVK